MLRPQVSFWSMPICHVHPRSVTSPFCNSVSRIPPHCLRNNQRNPKPSDILSSPQDVLTDVSRSTVTGKTLCSESCSHTLLLSRGFCLVLEPCDAESCDLSSNVALDWIDQWVWLFQPTNKNPLRMCRTHIFCSWSPCWDYFLQSPCWLAGTIFFSPLWSEGLTHSWKYFGSGSVGMATSRSSLKTVCLWGKPSRFEIFDFKDG